MTWMNDRLVTQRKEHLRDGSHQHVVVAARKIGAADRSGKERVADEEIRARFACRPI